MITSLHANKPPYVLGILRPLLRPDLLLQAEPQRLPGELQILGAELGLDRRFAEDAGEHVGPATDGASIYPWDET